MTISYHILKVPNTDESEHIFPGKLVLMMEGSLLDKTASSNLRSLEALRHVSVMVTIYDLEGHILLRNRASETELILEGDVHLKGIFPTPVKYSPIQILSLPNPAIPMAVKPLSAVSLSCPTSSIER
jgi:hypothetical protein